MVENNNTAIKLNYLEKLFEETKTIEDAKADNKNPFEEKEGEPEYIKDARKKLQSKISLMGLNENNYLLNKERPKQGYYCVFLGSEPEATNNPNSVPILTAIQALALIHANLREEDILILREHPHMLNGTRNLRGAEIRLVYLDRAHSSR